MIGIICAMEEEIRGIEKSMEVKCESVISSIQFKEGIYKGKRCVVALSGVGKVFATICTQTMIMKYSPRCIINVGTAGGIGHNINIFDLVIAKSVIQHDYDISAFGNKKRGELSKLGIRDIPCSKRIIKLAKEVATEKGVILHIGNILTGDQFISNSHKINELREEFNGLACEMECAAIGQVCHVNGVEFGAVKIISDGANKSSSNDFNNFIDKYPQIINDLIDKILLKI